MKASEPMTVFNSSDGGRLPDKNMWQNLINFWLHCLIQATVLDLIRPWTNVNGTLTEEWQGQDVTGAWSLEAENDTARIKVCK